MVLAADHKIQEVQLAVLKNNTLELTFSEAQMKQAMLHFSNCSLSKNKCLQNLQKATCAGIDSELALSSNVGCDPIDATQPIVPILFSALGG